MKNLRKYNSLSELAPTLVKEWHPTANGNLTPKNVEVVYPERIWWICSEGHEWQSTIKYRMSQNECPICEKQGVKKETDGTLSIPMLSKNRRKGKRFKTNAVVAIEVPTSGYWVYAEIKNICRHGMCIETDSVIRSGSVLRIKFDEGLVASGLKKSNISYSANGYKTYKSTVKWYRILDDDESLSSINIGLELN